MRTIQKILRYNFSKEKKKELLEQWIINWCWWKWWLNFDKILKSNIEYVPNFLQEKAEDLFGNIKELCFEHDYDFSIWGGLFSFLKANFLFARWIYLLMNWTHLNYRIAVFLIAFYLLNKHGKKYFNFISY